MNGRLRWGRILLGGLYSELAIFAVFIPLQSVYGDAVINIVPALAAAVAFLFGWWGAKGAPDRQVLHGVLVAVAASLMWIGLVLGSGGQWSEIPVLYHVTHGLRLMGGAAGGWWAARRLAGWCRPQACTGHQVRVRAGCHHTGLQLTAGAEAPVVPPAALTCATGLMHR